ncbi:long-chain fatty acid transporter-like protein [Cucurbitaria berberidis CBS 394.84]|uniref:Long-chain fatty acid transporter-like protein n=1 Tax=Cucurbitaria berberidis CBS 394.84 TaxID=1168544 RepID=A0A9P4GAH1_9PLEO|nr:long-chain fatty acid transporter-like protein [Cucurbitaria berberidis CBS 394.84]KAF1841841.1 long-chain fatty acid transporter-like protein [Cucurbitaria berberidis CBS 394.84]
MSALPYAIPAAAATFSYLNARHGLSYDLPMLSALASAAVSTKRHERSDTFNLFYELEAQAQSRENHAWIIFQGRTWTYKEAYDTVLRYGTWLKSKGVEKDEIVAMDFVNSDTFIWVWFGLWSIGAKPAFINYNLAGKSLVHSIKTSTARLVLVDQEGRDKFNDDVMREHGFVRTELERDGRAKYGFEMDQSDIPRSVRNQTKTPQAAVDAGAVSEPLRRQLEVVFFDDALALQILTLPPTRLPNVARDNQTRTSMAMLIYTSGTTGLPKPAIMSWGKCNGGTKFVSSWLSLKNNVLYTSMPLYHSSASVLGVCAVLRTGNTICLSKKFSHKTFWPEIRASNATMIHYVGETCRYLLSAPPSALDKQHKVRAAFGNGLRPDVWEAFKERFGIETIFEVYAATESPGGMWNHSRNGFSSGAIGRMGTLTSLLFASMLCLVRMDSESDPPAPLRSPSTGLCQICDWNEPGELMYKLDPNDISQKFQGYFGNAKATNSKIIRNVKVKGDAYFRSGDLLRRDKEGRWWFVDRIGDTFRWKAENVSTAEVSEAVGKHEAVVEANVYGVQVPHHDGRAGCAALVLKDSAATAMGDKTPLPSEQTLHSLAEHVKKELPAFAVPIWLRVTREMQITGTNKQQKHLLQQEGIDPSAVEASGDALYWLKGGKYQRFTKRDMELVVGGGVKL